MGNARAEKLSRTAERKLIAQKAAAALLGEGQTAAGERYSSGTLPIKVY